MAAAAKAVTAVERELKALGAEAVSPGLCAVALQMARELDDPDNSATSKSMCAKALDQVLMRLRELAPPRKESNPVDELRARRTARRKRPSAA